MQRQPAVAGQFYSGNAAHLRNDLNRLIIPCPERSRVTGIIAPHAGYMYSGALAGLVYGMIEIPATVLIIGPNHSGAGEAAALYPDGEWLTPLGAVAINSRLNNLLLEHAPFVREDAVAHRTEHSLEVQVPFLQQLRPDVQICALCLGGGDFNSLRELGEGIARAIQAFGEDVLIVASSDMTHFESAETAHRKDSFALDRLLAFDPEGLLRVCRSERISMCGVVPSVVMLVAAGLLGATRAEQVGYCTSGDVTGDNSQVVAYAAVTVA